MNRSPNHDARPAGQAIDILLLHYTGMRTGAAALRRLCDPAASVSAHYLIDEDGSVHALVPEARRAWHAGRAHWAGAEDINARSIGIELVNPGHEFGYRDFPPSQMRALRALGLEIVARHPIPSSRVLGHADVAPARKQDPGERFDWQGLAAAGLGLWPRPRPATAETLAPGGRGAAVRALRARLRRFGYGLADRDRYDDELAVVITAFQRHWRPARIDGIADGECQAILDALLDLKAAEA